MNFVAVLFILATHWEQLRSTNVAELWNIYPKEKCNPYVYRILTNKIQNYT